MHLARYAAVLSACALVGASCGGGAKQRVSSVTEQSYGTGARTVWVFRASERKPRALVIFFHGLGDEKETTPYYHRPWLRHLAEQGDVVFYPRFEVYPGDPGALRSAILGIRTAASKVDVARLPAVVIGYSRGGGLAVDYAAVAQAAGPVPKVVLAVFPAAMDVALDLRSVETGTRFVFLVGDQDTTVSNAGALRLTSQLTAAHYPANLVSTETVRSRGSFVATHLSVLEDTPGGRSAFWGRADRLIAGVVAAA